MSMKYVWKENGVGVERLWEANRLITLVKPVSMGWQYKNKNPELKSYLEVKKWKK